MLKTGIRRHTLLVPYFSDTSFWHQREQLKLKQHISPEINVGILLSVSIAFSIWHVVCVKYLVVYDVFFSHFHLDHCGALPYMSEMVGYEGKIYMTHPTKAICPIMLVSHSFHCNKFQFWLHPFKCKSYHCHLFCLLKS